MLTLIVGIAGPQWGSAELPTAPGRDIVIVLDLSRSMLAEQPSRQERAVKALQDLADTVRKRGGHRLALVVFAAHAKVICPLTHDYDHFRESVTRLDAGHLPPALRPQADGPGSGTRIGEALRLAVQTHDPRFQGNQDILLVSDGDDPAGDGEWAHGARAAVQARIPVYTVGVGDPEKSFPIPAGNGFLRHGHKEVQTRLDEGPLEEIARRTRGLYIPARTRGLPLGQWLREVIEPRKAWRENEEDMLPVPEPHYAWFFGAALALLAGGLCAGGLGGAGGVVRGAWRVARGAWRVARSGWRGKDMASNTAVAGRRDASVKGGDGEKPLNAAGAGIMAVVGVLLLAAGPQPAGDELLRQGNSAFHDEDYKQALDHYRRAETRADDPGLVAFNKATTLFRLERYREAELHYRRCLDDAEGLRRARALYDLGNCLLQQAGTRDARLLAQAAECYRQCRRVPEADAAIRDDATHNLELARLLWQRARKESSEPPNAEPEKDNQVPEKKKDNGQGESGDGTNTEGPPDSEPGKGRQGAEDTRGAEQKRPAPGRGDLRPLPDTEELVTLPAEDAAAYLQRLAERIRRERRDYWQSATPAVPNVKDW
jgi:Ca-activated chloride channel family protein